MTAGAGASGGNSSIVPSVGYLKLKPSPLCIFQPAVDSIVGDGERVGVGEGLKTELLLRTKVPPSPAIITAAIIPKIISLIWENFSFDFSSTGGVWGWGIS